MLNLILRIDFLDKVILRKLLDASEPHVTVFACHSHSIEEPRHVWQNNAKLVLEFACGIRLVLAIAFKVHT